MNKSIVSILAISVVLFQCQNDENEPNPYASADCACKVPGYVYVDFQEGTTIKQAQSYGQLKSDGIASVSGWFLTSVSADSAVFINDYLRKFRDSDNGLYVTAYNDYGSDVVSINFDAVIHANKVTMNTILTTWLKVMKDPIIKLEKYSVVMLLKVEEGTEQVWIDLHTKDSTVKKLDHLLLRCSCK